MKRGGRYSAFALIAFALGLSAALIWWRRRAGVDRPAPLEPEVDYYRLASEPGKYIGKDIRLRVRARVIWEGTLMECLLSEPASVRPVIFGVDYGPGAVESFARAEDALRVAHEDLKEDVYGVRRVDVILTGKFIWDEKEIDFLGRTYSYWLVISHLKLCGGESTLN